MYEALEVPTYEYLIVNPILGAHRVLEKKEIKTVYKHSLESPIQVLSRMYSYPVYIPEICGLLALDVISPQLARSIADLTGDFEGFYSENKVICSKLYNYDNKINRAVSRGQYTTFTLGDGEYDLYITNLINDFLITPSIVVGQGLYSPNRWFHIESEEFRSPIMFRANINFNVGLLYLEKEELKRTREISFWANGPIHIFEVRGGLVKLSENGFVDFKKVRVHFTSDPSQIQEEITNKGEYFRCFMISFNDYKTNYKKFPYEESFNINLVESLSELVHSPYDILPCLFPYNVNNVSLDSLIYNWEIKRNIFTTVCERFAKFSPEQSKELIDNYDGLMAEKNKLLEITPSKEAFHMKVVNPSVVPFLFKKGYVSDSRSILGKYAIEMINEKKLLSKLEDAEKTGWNKDFESLKFSHVLAGYKNFLGYRTTQLRNYSRIYSSLSVV
jgi:hypothetical protein